MREDLAERVLTFVRRARSASASEIAQSLGVTRSEVNSVLYEGLGRRFRKSEELQPRWSLLESEQTSLATRPTRVLPVISHHDFHIDFAGGDWKLRIVVDDASRNDPIARVEMLGERHRLVTVATYACGFMGLFTIRGVVGV